LTYTAAEFLTAKDVKNDYDDGVASFTKETGNFKITRHNHYDYDEYDYITFETYDHDFWIWTPSEHTINQKQYDVEL